MGDHRKKKLLKNVPLLDASGKELQLPTPKELARLQSLEGRKSP